MEFGFVSEVFGPFWGQPTLPTVESIDTQTQQVSNIQPMRNEYLPKTKGKFRASANFTPPTLSERSNINWKFSLQRGHTWRASSWIPVPANGNDDYQTRILFPRFQLCSIAGRAGWQPFSRKLHEANLVGRRLGRFATIRYAREFHE